MVLRLGPGKSHYIGLLLHGFVLEPGISRHRSVPLRTAPRLAGLVYGSQQIVETHNLSISKCWFWVSANRRAPFYW